MILTSDLLVPSRRHLLTLLEGRDLVGVEVGVYRGQFSEFLLESGRFREVVSIDPWLWNVFGVNPQTAYVETLARLERFGERSRVLRVTSEKAANLFVDSSIDFIYIDAAHDYKNVALDMKIWWGKLKAGGLFAGHDFDTRQPGVMQAVKEHAADHGLPIGVTGTGGGGYDSTENDLRSWYFLKE